MAKGSKGGAGKSLVRATLAIHEPPVGSSTTPGGLIKTFNFDFKPAQLPLTRRAQWKSTPAAAVRDGTVVDATRDHFAKRAPVGPDSVRASRSYPGHSPRLAFDKISNTWWGPGVSQSGEGEWVEARFDQPTRLLDLVITSGTSTKVDQLQQSALPHRVEARITTADGKTSTRIINLDQSAGGQRRKFRVGEVVAVRFTLRSAYAADAKKQVAIAEIEFFGRSNSNTS